MHGVLGIGAAMTVLRWILGSLILFVGTVGTRMALDAITDAGRPLLTLMFWPFPLVGTVWLTVAVWP